MSQILLLTLWLYQTTVVLSHREHKVHNIVLYPEKHSWCKTTPIKQVVGHPGCTQREVDNNVCVGACFSYSIPKTEPTAPGEVLPYCDSCQPSSVSWKQVELSCENERGLTKKVEIIEDCACLSCPAPPNDPGQTGEGDQSPPDVPQLLGLLHKANSTSHTGIKHSESLSLSQVEELISQISGGQNKLDDEEDQVKIDVGKLRTLLARMETKSSHRHHRHQGHPRKEDDLEPTLDMAPHHLKPALEGEEITYLAGKPEEEETNTQTTE